MGATGVTGAARPVACIRPPHSMQMLMQILLAKNATAIMPDDGKYQEQIPTGHLHIYMLDINLVTIMVNPRTKIHYGPKGLHYR